MPCSLLCHIFLLLRDRRELTALRRERDVAQTMINQLRASRDSPVLFGNASALVNKWTSKDGGAGPPERPLGGVFLVLLIVFLVH